MKQKWLERKDSLYSRCFHAVFAKVDESQKSGVPPAVEPGILPCGFLCGHCRQFVVQSCHSGRQDAALYGSQDGCHYSGKPTLNTYDA